jgi:UTP-glucose-1-phosphate uridylyltransferase
MVEYIIVTGRGRNALESYFESNMQLKAGLEYRIFCS